MLLCFGCVVVFHTLAFVLQKVTAQSSSSLTLNYERIGGQTTSKDTEMSDGLSLKTTSSELQAQQQREDKGMRQERPREPRERVPKRTAEVDLYTHIYIYMYICCSFTMICASKIIASIASVTYENKSVEPPKAELLPTAMT